MANSTKGFAWKTLEQYSVAGIQLIIQIILARILGPTIYGTLAIVNIFIAVAAVFVQKGFGTALVRKENCDELDYSSVLFFSFGLSIVLAAIIFVCAPFISSFYEIEGLELYIRAMSIILIIGSVTSVQNAIIRRNLRFKLNFFASFISVILSGVVGIFLAINGYGVWALVLQQIVYHSLNLIVLLIGLKWLPKLAFSFDRLKELFSFGWKVLAVGIVDEVFAQVRSALIGKQYDSKSLAYYNKGQQFPNFIARSINGSMQAVLLPVLSKKQNSSELAKNTLRNSIKLTTFILFPMLIGLFFVSDSLIPLLLSDEWKPAIIFVKIFCIYYITWPLITPNTQMLYAIGNSKSVLFAEIVQRTLDIISIIVFLSFGTFWIAIGAAIVSLISVLMYSFLAKKYYNYTIAEQVSDVFLNIIISLIMGFVIYSYSFYINNYLLLVVFQVVTGIILYFLFSFLINKKCFLLFFRRINNLFSREH